KHHSGEDAGVWPFLLQRADEDERVVLLAMEAEHDRIDPQLESCEHLLAELARGGQDRDRLRAQLSVRLAETRELLDHHLRHEESEAIAILQRHTTQEEWDRLEEEYFGESRKDLPYLLYVCNWIAEDLSP